MKRTRGRWSYLLTAVSCRGCRQEIPQAHTPQSLYTAQTLLREPERRLGPMYVHFPYGVVTHQPEDPLGEVPSRDNLVIAA